MNFKKRLLGIFLCMMFTFTGSVIVYAKNNQKHNFPGLGCKENQQLLEKIAKEKGITVEELKKQLKAEHKARFEKMAKERGISVDALKAQLKAEHRAKLESLAKEKGITVEELKKQFLEKKLLERNTTPN